MLSMHEGRGFLVHTAVDGPLRAAVSTAYLLDGTMASQPALSWLQTVGALLKAMPGGLDLLWESCPLSWEGLATCLALPRLTVHVDTSVGQVDALANVPHGTALWLHSAAMPTGELGLAWRQGRLGWVPEAASLEKVSATATSPFAPWSVPGVGHVKQVAFLWGEVILPVGALSELQPQELATCLAGIQSDVENRMSFRMTAGAWPSCLPFHRRQAGWRVALLGGREYLASCGQWEKAAEQLKALLETLQKHLKCPLWAGSCEDFVAAGILGRQAMGEALPWRSALPLPPHSPDFSVGFSADPREAVSLEARSLAPASLSSLLSYPSVAWLRVPKVPDVWAAENALRGQVNVPAVYWLPPDVVVPGPFLLERPWASTAMLPPLMEKGQASQPMLFEEDELSHV